MNIHKKRKHPIISVCEICEKQFDSQKNLKMHKYTHSYTSKGDIGQTCQKCNFECDTIESMEIHLGKCNVEEFECGLCESKFKSEEEIDTHLKTCEVYECSDCYIRYKTLGETKKHLKNYHETEAIFQSLHHLKMERDDISKVKFKRYFLSEV